MNNLKLSVTGNRLKITEDTITTEGSINYDGCVFNFDKSWEGFTKTAVFSTDKNDCYRVTLSDDSCTIPSICLEREGLVRIGVFGVSDDDVIITTNSVAHRVDEGIPMTEDWMEEDNALVVNAVQELQKIAEEYTTKLSQRVSEEIDDLREAAGAFSGDRYEPDWYTPIAFEDGTGAGALSQSGTDYSDYLNFRLEPLRSEFPEYVTRSELGTDTDGENKIYAYTFTPSSYEKTMLITACTHGNEECTLLAASHFFDCLCRKYKSSSVLRKLHQSVKIIFIPVLNPYGLMNKSIYNKNGVNIDRNFPHNWDDCTDSHKGGAAADQTETQLMIEYLKEVKNDKLCACIELHTNNSAYAGRAIYYTKNHSSCATTLAELVNSFNYDYDYSDYTDEAILAPSNGPFLSDYASTTYGIDAIQLVWTTNLYGGAFTEYCITKYSELIGNAINTMAKSTSFIPFSKPQPFVRFFSWCKSDDSDAFAVTSTDKLVKMPMSAYSLRMNSPYNLLLNGYVELEVQSECTVTVNPALYQDYSTEQNYTSRKASENFTREFTLKAGTHIIPIFSVLQAYFSSFNLASESRYCDDVRFVLMFSASVSDGVKVNSFSVVLNATPSDSQRSLEISSPVGMTSDYTENAIPTQKLIFPLNTYGKNDEYYHN